MRRHRFRFIGETMISSIGSSSAGYDTASIQQMRSQLAEKLFKTADANQDGKVTADELSNVMQAKGNKQGPSASEIIKQLDQGNNGYITEQDLEAGLAKLDHGKQPQGPPKGRPGEAGAPHAGGGREFVEGQFQQHGHDHFLRPGGSQPGWHRHHAGKAPVRGKTLRRSERDSGR